MPAVLEANCRLCSIVQDQKLQTKLFRDLKCVRRWCSDVKIGLLSHIFIVNFGATSCGCITTPAPETLAAQQRLDGRLGSYFLFWLTFTRKQFTILSTQHAASVFCPSAKKCNFSASRCHLFDVNFNLLTFLKMICARMSRVDW